MYRIGQVAARLDISPTTLRRWSDRFSEWLSEEGGNPELLDSGRRATRMYNEEDLTVLSRIKQLKDDGLSEEEVEAYLHGQGLSEDVAAPRHADGEIVLSSDGGSAIQVLQQAVDAQKAIMTAQQAQRDLLHAVLSDAMGLKDENERLRKRLRTVEEEMSRLKESDWNHRLALEERMNQLERQASTDGDKQPWWRRLLGG